MLPQLRHRLDLRYFEALAELFLSVWVAEIDRLAYDRAAPSEQPSVTTADVDKAFSVVLNAMPFSRRPRLGSLVRRAGLIYSAPYLCPPAVLAHFERQAQLFVSRWAAETEKLGYSLRGGDIQPILDRSTIERAMSIAVVNAMRHRTDATKVVQSPDQQRVSRRGWFWSWFGWLLMAIGSLLALARNALPASHQHRWLLIAIMVSVLGILLLAWAKYGKGG
jgi:hypothetical protein